MAGPSDWLAVPRTPQDDVADMQALLERHRQLTWLRPGVDDVDEHTATWPEVGHAGDEGGTVTVSRERLGMLVAYLGARLGCG